MHSDLLTSGDVARRLGISTSRVARLAVEGELQPAVETRLGRLFDAQHVEDVAAMRARAAESNWRITSPVTVSERGHEL
jgi:MerR HTH family regulatory protein